MCYADSPEYLTDSKEKFLYAMILQHFWFHVEFFMKGPDHLATGLGHLGRFGDLVLLRSSEDVIKNTQISFQLYDRQKFDFFWIKVILRDINFETYSQS